MTVNLITAFMGGNLALNALNKLYDIWREPIIRAERQTEMAEQRRFQRQLQLESFQKQIELIEINRQNSLDLQENAEILRQYPLTLHRSQIFAAYERAYLLEKPVPLTVLLVPPRLKRDRSQGQETAPFSVELRLNDIIRQSIGVYFSQGLVDLKTGIWKSNDYYGEASVAYLHQIFPSLPMLVLESSVEGEWLYFNAGFWTSIHRSYNYLQLARVNIGEVLNHYAKEDAANWNNLKDALGGRELTPEEKNFYDYNLKLLKEEQHDAQLKLELKRRYPYKYTNQNWQRFTEELSACHSMVVGWISDAYQLETAGRVPLLPGMLPNLINNGPLAREIAVQTVNNYRQIYSLLEARFPHIVPGMQLELSRSLRLLPDKSLAEAQIDAALESWLRARNIKVPSDTKELFETVIKTALVDDRDYRDELRAIREAIAGIRRNDKRVVRIDAMLDQWFLSGH